ncbi:hypothetical protein BVZ31_19195 [Alcaligenes faecalis]|nr:hypothetical protein BVZ30_00070 [Alcaligenes faecalis]OSZ47165.1 hypothetical protein BVZ31_19195 [Alcaligenes faecalis]OSZ54122.1 hypothetical protein BVZ32_05150 [Alcaligenes faecalis]
MRPDKNRKAVIVIRMPSYRKIKIPGFEAMCGIKGAFIQLKMGMRQVGALRVSMLFASRKQAIFRPFLGV